MRRLLFVFALMATMSDAYAGDYDVPVLRGSEPVVPGVPFGQAPPLVPRWAGFYVGGQVGWGVSNLNFAGATQPLFAHELRELLIEQERQVSSWEVLGQADTAIRQRRLLCRLQQYLGGHDHRRGLHLEQSQFLGRCSGLADQPRDRYERTITRFTG